MSGHDWIKPGVQAVVTVADTYGNDFVWLRNSGVYVAREALSPLPEPLTELERAVVEAAERWADAYENAGLMGRPYQRVAEAAVDMINTLRAARAPRDPVAELVEDWKAAREYVDNHDPALRIRMDAAIAAVEGAKK